MTTFAVRVEGRRSGKTLTLKGGFPTQEAAEDHPVRLADWARVWVEAEAPPPARKDDMPPRPWSVLWVGGYAYVVDAEGSKIATIYGTPKRKAIMSLANTHDSVRLRYKGNRDGSSRRC